MANATYTVNKRVRRLLGMKSSEDITDEIITEAVLNASDLVQGIIGKDVAAAAEASGTGDSTPQLLRTITTIYAAYIAYASVYAGSASKGTFIADLYSKAEGWAEAIRDGKMDIREITTQFQVDSNRDDYSPALGIDEPTEWAQDTDLTDDLEDDRS